MNVVAVLNADWRVISTSPAGWSREAWVLQSREDDGWRDRGMTRGSAQLWLFVQAWVGQPIDPAAADVLAQLPANFRSAPKVYKRGPQKKPRRASESPAAPVQAAPAPAPAPALPDDDALAAYWRNNHPMKPQKLQQADRAID